MSKVARTSQGLRDALFEELDNLRSGVSNPQRANALAKVSSQIVNSVKLEMDYSKHLAAFAELGKHNALVPIVKLGE